MVLVYFSVVEMERLDKVRVFWGAAEGGETGYGGVVRERGEVRGDEVFFS